MDKLSYEVGEEVKGTISFDFGAEAVKVDKIIVGLTKKTSAKRTSVTNGVSSSKSTSYKTLMNMNLADKGEYTKEEIPFNFIVPNEALAGDVSFDKLLKKIPEPMVPLVNLLVDMFLPNMRKKSTFNIVARLDIPWGIDIKEEKIISIN